MDQQADLDAWEAALAPAVEAAIRQWATTVTPMVLPSLTAASDLPPDMQRAGDGDESWLRAFITNVLPVLTGLMAGHTWRVLRARGITPTPPAAPSGPTSTAAHLPMPDHLLTYLSAADRDALLTDVQELRRMLGDLVPDDTRYIIDIGSWRDHIASHLEHVTNRCRDMPDAVFDQIRTSLREGMLADETPTELRDRVQQILTDTGTDSPLGNRAMTIARTEATAGYNAAAHEAAIIEADETGETMHHAWVATVDGRTRHTHFAADGQRVQLDEPFLVGGHQLRYPGDPGGPAAEVINCRCTTLVLAEDEPLPGEEDRQTERPAGQSRHRTGTQADEIERRRREGVTRAREDPAGIGITAAAQEDKMARTFSGALAPIGKPTGDGRIIADGAKIAFREFPFALMWQKQTADGHDGAVTVGRIDHAEVDGDRITGRGVLYPVPEAEEAAIFLADAVTRPSVDLCDVVADYQLLDADGDVIDLDDDGVPTREPASELMIVREATVMSATLVAKPAFAEAKLVLGEEVADDDGAGPDQLVAALPPVPDRAVFDDPCLEAPTPVTVTDGRVVGHLATWGTCHVGMPGRCVTPPASPTAYAHFHTSSVDTAQGRVAVGRLTVGGGHAGPRDTATQAAAHYDDTGTCWAFVRAGEDEHGIWVAGIVNPAADDRTVTAGATAPLSGDWRTIGGSLELVAALSVNTPGFPVVREHLAASGAPASLVAAGAMPTATGAPGTHALSSGAVRAIVAATLDEMNSRDARTVEAAAIRHRHAAAAAARITNRHRTVRDGL